MQAHIIQLIVFLLASSFLACGRDFVSLRTATGSSLDAEPENIDGRVAAIALAEIASEDLRTLWLSAATTQISEEILDALIECQCAPKLGAQLLRQNLKARGVLHQALMPSIRSEIRNDPDLASLLSLPNGIRDVVREIFAGDEDISLKIRDSIVAKLKSMWPDAESAKLTEFVFDGLSPLFGQQSNEFISHPSSFKVQEQAIRWRMIFRSLTDAIRSGAPHPDQIVAVAKALSEWKYLFGMEADSAGEVFGGLTLDARDGDGSVLRSFDPRKDREYIGFLSGVYEVFYPTGETIDLATSVKEIWYYQKKSVRLVEQSLLWEAAAEAYLQLRPQTRKNWDRSLGLSSSPIPLEAHQLSLVFLKSLEVLLDGPFIDRDRRIIRSSAVLGTGVIDDTPADINELSHFVRSLTKWALAMRGAEADGLDPAITEEMQRGFESIKEPLRLGVFELMQRFDETIDSGAQLKAIASLLPVAQEILPSAMLSQWISSRLPALVHRLALRWSGESSASQPQQREAMLWLANISLYEGKILESELTTELARFRSSVEQILSEIYGQQTVRAKR